MLKILPLIILIFLFFNAPVNAEHIIGGEITYEQVDTNKLKLRMVLYRDCTAIPMSNTKYLYVKADSCYNSIDSVLMSVVPGSVKDVSNTCPSFPATDCPGSPSGTVMIPTSTEIYVFEGEYIIPSGYNCSNWKFSYIDCCRGVVISTINFSQSFYIEALYNQQLGSNNSPQFRHLPVLFMPANKPGVTSFFAHDIDGDSVVIDLVPVMMNDSQMVTYNPGVSPDTPMHVMNISFDSITGILSVEPNGVQIGVIAAEAREYRNGILVGRVVRDIQLVVSNHNNPMPDISGINNGNYNDTIIYAGNAISFDITGTDPNPFQNVTMEWDSGIVGANYIVNGNVASFSWTPDTADIRWEPHFVFSWAHDDGCPVPNSNIAGYRIYVLNPDTTNVWPGDANNDLKADIYDLLPIGIAAGATGMPRPGASTNWTAQPATNWANNFHNGLNYKYADANGDGLVDTNDAAVVSLNYGLTHNKIYTVATPAGSADIGINILADTVFAGQVVTAEVFMGEMNDPVTDIYGIAFKIFADPAFVEAGTMTFDISGNWLGSGSDIATIAKDEGNGNMAVGIVKMDGQNASGYGKIGELTFQVNTALTGGNINDLALNITGVKAIDKNEQEKLLTTGADTVAVVHQHVGINDPAAMDVKIYPNPASDLITVETSRVGSVTLTLMDQQGRVMQKGIMSDKIYTMDIAALPAGIYFLHITTAEVKAVRKVVIE